MRTIEDERARQRAKAANKVEASAYPRIIKGNTAQGWNEALSALVIALPERCEGHIN